MNLGHVALIDLASRVGLAERANHLSVRVRMRQRERIQSLEEELARVSLLANALANLCLDKGLITLDELSERMKALEAAAERPGDATPSGRPKSTTKRRRRGRSGSVLRL